MIKYFYLFFNSAIGSGPGSVGIPTKEVIG